MKNLLRQSILQQRKGFLPDSSSNSDICSEVVSILNTIYDHKIKHNNILGVYWSLNGEPDVMRVASELKWQLALPKVLGTHIEYVRYDQDHELESFRGTSIMQPVNDDFIVPRVLIVPGLAFSVDGYRLGFGGGYYDRYISSKRKEHTITTIGVVFDENLVEYLPKHEQDVKYDYIVTNKLTIKY